MIHATVNNKTFDIELSESGKKAIVNNEAIQPDIVRIDGRTMHILLNDRSYNAEIAEINHETKEMSVVINGRSYAVQIKDRFDDLIRSLGFESATGKKFKEVKAPMPGMVLNVMVQAGDNVEKETPLIILEAMKMENVIKSPVSGTVKRIGVGTGQAVEKNTILIEFT